MSSQLVRIQTKITAKNEGSSPETKIVVGVHGSNAKKLAYINCVITVEDDDDIKLTVTELESAAGGHRLFSVELDEALKAGSSKLIDVTAVFTHALRPHPAAIGQSEKQLVLFRGSHYLLSPYQVAQQTTTVKLPSSTIESYTKLKPSSSNENSISFGPYRDLAPLSESEMDIHFENNMPFLTVNQMTRWLEVSHWGNVAVEETYHMTHTGAALKGHFSRYDYQRSPTYSAIKSFKSVLPASARDVYYRDEIGNISTSNMNNMDDSVELEIRPRFPLFGGWQTRYYMGYNVPTFEYLYNKGDKYVLRMRLVDHVYDDFVVDRLEVKVVLPEGAKDIEVTAPYSIERAPQQLHKTYLDTSGRPVVVVKKDNVVDNHIQDFQVQYTFHKFVLLQEPLLCVAAFYILFMTVIGIVRLDFSISKDEAQDSRMKVSSLLDELRSAVDQRSAVYAAFDSAVDKFKASKDAAAFVTAQKKCQADYTNVSSKVNAVGASLIKEDAELTEKVAEVQRKETERKAQLEQLVALATKVVSGKINRTQFSDGEASAKAKREKLEDEIEAIVGAL